RVADLVARSAPAREAHHHAGGAIASRLGTDKAPQARSERAPGRAGGTADAARARLWSIAFAFNSRTLARHSCLRLTSGEQLLMRRMGFWIFRLSFGEHGERIFGIGPLQPPGEEIHVSFDRANEERGRSSEEEPRET